MERKEPMWVRASTTVAGTQFGSVQFSSVQFMFIKRAESTVRWPVTETAHHTNINNKEQ